MSAHLRGPVRDLTVVMPVYNEADGIECCVRSWVDVLCDLGIRFRIDLYDDGSTDGTDRRLVEVARLPHVQVTSKANEGHGPTILRGYRDAVQGSEWVFQVDSDDEIPASAFPSVWAAADADTDAVLGVRVGREQTVDRLVMTKVAALTTRALYSSRVTDVNVPFRLVRSEVLSALVDRIPPDTFAPNVAISGALGRRPGRLREVEVRFTPRRTGTVSIAGLSILRPAARSFVQTVRLSRALR